jgi:hypothetical protein
MAPTFLDFLDLPRNGMDGISLLQPGRIPVVQSP